ncbi:MAG: TrbL/VirB6 family protein [Minisyncoccota bacterium]
MKKILSNTLILMFAIGVLAPTHVIHAQGIAATIFGGFTDIIGTLLSPIAYAIMGIMSLLPALGGLLLNATVYYTIIQMAQTFTDVTAINTAWTVLRDLANMTFIFVILFASIQLIIGQGKDTQRLIVNMIIAAILINFSLFFTKVIIDVANLLALTFYSAIAPGATNEFATAGMANAIMDSLKVTTLYQASGDINGANVLTIAIMSSIVFLVTAFVFFAISIMLIIRYVVLIFLLILSPLMFVSMILPKLQGYTKKWWDALIGQAFFAPVYFLLTWVTVVVVRGISDSTFSATGSFADALNGLSGSIPILINFIVIIVFLVASLVIAKGISNQAGPQVADLTKWAMGAASGAAGMAGRKSIGRLGAKFDDNKKLLANAEESKSWGTRATSRLALYAGKKAASGTFDIRNAAVPTGVVSDTVRGTVGRTQIGKKLGLNRFDGVGSIEVGSRLSGIAGAGAGETKGFSELESEKGKAWSKIESEEKQKLRSIKNSDEVNAGMNATPGSQELKTMESAVSKMTDKEVEAVVSGNKKLLSNQNFANSLSVKQLDALIKSDKFSDDDKDAIKSVRFKDINVAMASGGVGAVGAKDKIRNLSDSELEMIDHSYLEDEMFVAQMKSGQIDTVGKSNNFTTSQKNTLRTLRQKPIKDAIIANDATVAQNYMLNLSPKEVNALGVNTLANPLLLPAFTPNMLKRMAQDMNTSDIQTLRKALLASGNQDTKDWLNDPNTGVVDFS